MLPPGVTPAAMVAVSWIEPPIVASVAAVEIVGEALATVEVSPAASQAELTALLLPSPEYSAVQLYSPAAVGLKLVDPYSPLPLTATNLLKTGPLAQPESFGTEGFEGDRSRPG